MSEKLWTAVDHYLEGLFIESDPVLEAILHDQHASGLPPIHVAPLEGKFLHILARLVNAKRVLEIGTLAGYSTVLLARALPDDGKVVTLEFDPKHAEVARRSFARAGQEMKIALCVGPALETLPQLREEGHVFDLIFIDADKENNVHYVKHALAMSHPGTLIVVDNVIRDGDVINADSTIPMTQGVRRMNEYVQNEPRLTVTALQTVGAKGYDGMAIMLVNS
jgi:predicted O-methyltransferase YrrM